MVTNQDLFDVEGLQIGGNVIVISGASAPNITGYTAPMGSLYLRTNGETWKKVGLSDYDWTIDTVAGNDDDSGYVLKTRSVMVMDTYEVEVDVGLVSFNHYYEEGVQCKLQAPNYYQHPITIKNLSGNSLEIIPEFGRVEGQYKLHLNNKMSSVTLEALHDDWILTAHVDGYPIVRKIMK